jgi:hypothetical protein
MVHPVIRPGGNAENAFLLPLPLSKKLRVNHQAMSKVEIVTATTIIIIIIIIIN